MRLTQFKELSLAIGMTLVLILIFSTNSNAANIDVTSATPGINNNETIDDINNWSSITDGFFPAAINNNGTITYINNSGTITGSWIGINNNGTITGVINNANGTITGDIGINANGSIGSIVNFGNITAVNNGGIGILVNNNSVSNITNTGSIVGDNAGIQANFSVNTLENLQGVGNNNGALTIRGASPTNYNIIINSSTHYGQLSYVDVLTDTMIFGISNLSAGSAAVSLTTYSDVLRGINNTQLGITGSSLTATSNGYHYTLSQASTYSTDLNWDLLVSSYIPTSDTQASLTRQASSLRGVHNIASLISHYPNSSTYDCNLFDVKGMCISAGGRYSTVDNPSSNSSAAVVTLGYKVSPNIRIGGFLDQSVTNNNPTGIDISNKHPMMGAFAYWNQNADGLGYQVKIANAYQDKDLTTTRDVIGLSEAGRGTTSLNSRSYVGELSYAFMYKENTLVRPYFALRHTTIEQDAYTERGVTTPLTYSAINNRTTSALMGVKFKHALTSKANLIGSLGVEQDLDHKIDQLTATAAGIAGLTSENLSSDLHRTRPVASIGATYDIAKTQRLSGEVLVQQLPFQSTAGATAYFNYMIGF
jgi:hypothetical protein